MDPDRRRPSLRVLDLVCALVLALGLGWGPPVPAQTAAPPEASVFPTPETQRDWSGTWLMNKDQGPHNPYASCCLGTAEWVPFTAKYRKIRDDYAQLPEYTVAKNTNNLADCISPGVPGQLEHPSRFEFLLTPERVTMIHEEGTVRRIWTDGRRHPADVKPSAQGYSIGHWEDGGRVLVIETRAISPQSELFMNGPIKVTTKTQVTEHFALKSAQSLELHVTVEDPELFTQPYRYTRAFMKIGGVFEVGCSAYNRDNGHDDTINLTPPPEVTVPTPANGAANPSSPSSAPRQ